MRRLPSPSAVLATVATTIFVGPSLADWSHEPGLGVPICTAPGDQVLTTVVTDGAGGAIIGWSDRRGGATYDVYAQHVFLGGGVDPAWPVNGRAISDLPGNQELQRMVADGAGGAIICWADRRSGTDYDIYAQHVLASGAIDPAWPLDGVAICVEARDQQVPDLVSDGSGGAIITWQDARSDVYGDIYAHHLLASGALDGAWPAGGRALAVAASNQNQPRITTDGAGGAIVTWSDDRAGPGGDVWVQHVPASGVADPAWPDSGVALCTAYSTQFEPLIVSDDAGGAIVTWYDARNGAYDIYAHRVLSSGVPDPAWPIDGRALCKAADEQSGNAIVGDGSGGAFVAWHDPRTTEYDIYAQHVLSYGTNDAAWPVNGLAVCTATGHQSWPSMVSDGAEGVIVAWLDGRGPLLDTYAQHVLATGVDPAWAPNGVALTDSAKAKEPPVLLADGAGGAIAVLGNYHPHPEGDVHAQRITASGHLGNPEPTSAGDPGVSGDAGGEVGEPSLGFPSPSPAARFVRMRVAVFRDRRATLTVHDLAGRQVRSLLAGTIAQGDREIVWDLRDGSGVVVADGVYYVRLSVAERSVTRRIVVVR